MNILITNTALDKLGGTQTVVIALCRHLRQRGHQVMVFSSQLGHVAELLVEQHFCVVNNLADLPHVPDIIHGQHHLETIAALLALPETPALYYVHGVVPWEERLPVHPRILGYICLSEPQAFRLVTQKSIDPARVQIFENAVDFDANQPPKKPPVRLRTAAFCPRGQPTPELCDQMRVVCREVGIDWHHEKAWETGSVADPESVYRENDLIFGTGRTALEALAAGCAVSLTNHDKLGPLVTPENMELRRAANLTVRLSEDAEPKGRLVEQLKTYSVEDQMRVHRYIRENANMKPTIDRLISTYEKIIAEWNIQPRPAPAVELRAASNYLRSLVPLLRDHERLVLHKQRNTRLRARIRLLRARNLRQKLAHEKVTGEHEKRWNELMSLLSGYAAAHPFRRILLGSFWRQLAELLARRE